jgi:hypothetical protein
VLLPPRLRLIEHGEVETLRIRRRAIAEEKAHLTGLTSHENLKQ